MSSIKYLQVIVLMLVILSIKFDTTSQSLIGRIVYLAVDENDVMNLWMADLANPDQAEKLTGFNVPNTRIFEYQVSNDGHFIIYMAYNLEHNNLIPEANEEIMFIDTQTRETRQITSCRVFRASCYQFSLSPDGDYIIYQLARWRMSEIRLIDLNTPNFDEQIIDQIDLPRNDIFFHAFPTWVGTTEQVAYNSLPERRVQIFNIQENILVAELSRTSRVYFSPDGMRYTNNLGDPEMVIVRETTTPFNTLIKYHEYDQLSQGWFGAFIQDWHPDSEQLLITSGYLRRNEITGYADIRLLIINTTTGDIHALPHEEEFYDRFATWNHDGTQILFQRIPPPIQNTESNYCDYGQIMIYDVATEEIIELPIWGSRPQWLNYRQD